jgi:hypothetical protein
MDMNIKRLTGQAKEIAYKGYEKARYIAKETEHIATHDLAPATSKVLIKDSQGRTKQILRKEVKASDKILQEYKTILTPIPSKKQVARHYANPFTMSSLQPGKLYYPRKKEKKHKRTKKPKWAF